MRITILPSAQRDLARGFTFYKRQGEGLGHYFTESLIADIDSLKVYGGIHQRVFGYHRLLSKRFPYAVYYSVEAEDLLVRAVLDCRRDPAWIREELKG